jgi:hypothetical protein
VGFITPVAAVTFGVPGAAARGIALTTIFGVLWLLIGIGLHFLARRLVGGLKE